METYVADNHIEDTWSDINSIDEDDSYIEIELDASPICYNGDDDDDKSNLKGSCCTQYNDDDDDDDGGSKEYQLRISISSTIPVSLEDDHKENLRNSTVPNMTAMEAPCMSPLMSISADDATARSFTESQEIIMPLQHSSVVSKKIGEQGVEVEFSMQNRLCNTVPFNRRVGLESAQLDGQTTTLRAARVIPYDKVDVLYASARKQPNLTTTTTTTTTRTTTINGGIMKLLIKFRGIKIGTLLASLMKPRQPCHANNGQKSSKKPKTFFQSKKFFQCYQEKLVNPTNGRCKNKMKRDQGRSRSHKNWDLEDDNSICSGSLRSSSKKSSSRVMEKDLGALRGIFNAMGMSIAHKGSGSKRSSSQSTSCDTTPIHEGFSLYSSENSNVQAAIAYCKSSFWQSSDFSF